MAPSCWASPIATAVSLRVTSSTRSSLTTIPLTWRSPAMAGWAASSRLGGLWSSIPGWLRVQQLDAGVERPQVRDRHGQAIGELDDGPDERIDLERSSGLEVLQHRRLMGAHPRGAADSPVDADRDFDTYPPGHGIDLLHGGAHHRFGHRIAGDPHQGRPRQRAHRIEDRVAEQLDPDLVADL